MVGNAKRTIVCFGAGPKFKGGMANYNTSLAKAFDALPNTDVHLVSWTQQYPSIVPREFVDKTSTIDFLQGTNIKVKYILNYNNPMSWHETYRYLVSLKPSKVIFQWSIAVQGIPLGYLARKLAKHKDIEVVFDLHFVQQKENSSLDRWFTKIGIKKANTFVVHAYKTYHELCELLPNSNYAVSESGERIADKKNVIKLYHPIYDLFKADENFDIEAFKTEHNLKKNVFLFFGFIRKYKGLHYCLEAFAELAKQRDDVSLLICGESFWNTLDNKKWSTKLKQLAFGVVKLLLLKKEDDEKNYNPLALIDTLGLKDKVMLVNEFVPNQDVPQYFQASDAVVLFYEYATPSGVESLSYNFNMPILASKVGHFPETVRDGFNGYLAEGANVKDMVRVMQQFLTHPIDRENVRKSAENMSWVNYAQAILHD